MKHIGQKRAEKIFVISFCVFLAILLLLGDGKQHVVDVFTTAAVLLSYAISWYWRLLSRPLPRSHGLAWFALITYSLARAITSDGVGYSITATMRMFDAYLIYTLFYSVASVHNVRLFTKGAVGVACVAVTLAGLFLLIPYAGEKLSSMNLLFTTYGHNHVADILVFILPLVFMMNTEKKSLFLWGLVGVFLFATVATFARGAWLVLALYCLWYFLRHPGHKYGAPALIVSAVFVGLLVAWSGYIPQSAQRAGISRVQSGLRKADVFSDPRIAYWKQGLQAFVERPLFGSGPGTFLLESKRFQENPGTTSWFAHSFPLEALVELGLVGLVLWTILFFILAHTLLPHYGKEGNVLWRGLLWSVFLTLLYGFF